MPTAEIQEWKSDPCTTTEWPETQEYPPVWEVSRQADAMLVIGVLERLELNERWKAEIERAQAILELEDDWDGEGSPPYSRTTLDRAIAFVTSYGRRLWEMHGMQLPIPKIGPGPDASIDLHWKQTSRELLVNIPADANQLSVFYGDNYGTQSIKGSIDLDDFNLVLAQWLTN